MTRPRTGKGGCATALIIITAMLLAACAPFGNWWLDRLDSGDATLNYAEGGLIFDPLEAPAYDARLSARGSELDLTTPRNDCEVSEDRQRIACELGTITAPEFVGMTGKGVIASVRYTREPDSLDWLWAYTPAQ